MIEVLELCECALKNKSVYRLEATYDTDQMIQEYKVVLFCVSDSFHDPDIVLTNKTSGKKICVNVRFNPYLWFVNFYDAKKALQTILKRVSDKCWLKSMSTV